MQLSLTDLQLEIFVAILLLVLLENANEFVHVFFVDLVDIFRRRMLLLLDLDRFAEHVVDDDAVVGAKREPRVGAVS